MDVVPDLKRDVWHFGSGPTVNVAGIQDGTFTPKQRTLLENL